jgi:hypothetical protein
MISRRKFMKAGAVTAAAVGVTGEAMAASKTDYTRKFVHQVYFWLKEPEDAEHRKKLAEGLKTLTAIKELKLWHIGYPADTNRDVIDRSYSISWLTIFESKKDQDIYQDHPVHVKFVEGYSSLWQKVVVYDAEPLI